ncbi:MAG: enoyl-CoA hydratase/isomerase family protein [Planctomycetota bacterium]
MFCAGMDLKDVVIDAAAGGSGDPDLPLALLESLARLTGRIRRLPCVTVARVNGAAIGGGCGLACVCDVALTHADAKLGFPEVDLGICPAVVAPWLVKKIGAGPARAVLLRGGLMSGADAFSLGLVDEVAPDRDALDTLCDAVVARLLEGGPAALAATKKLVNELDGSLDDDVLLRGAALSAEILARDEAQAKLTARLAPASKH